MTNLTENKITELVLDARWSVGFVVLDGASHIYLKFDHPRHGELVFHLTPDSAKNLYGHLIKMTNETVQ